MSFLQHFIRKLSILFINFSIFIDFEVNREFVLNIESNSENIIAQYSSEISVAYLVGLLSETQGTIYFYFFKSKAFKYYETKVMFESIKRIHLVGRSGFRHNLIPYGFT
jgi:hypothetical protein